METSANLTSIITTIVTTTNDTTTTTTAITSVANTTSNTSTTDIFTFKPNAGNIAEIVVLILLCVLILLGNALVVLAFIKGPRSIRTLTNYFVVNLAVCDFMVGCLSVPSWILVRLSATESTAFLRYFISMDVLFGTASILSLVAISLERMSAVSYPTQHHNMSKLPVYAALLSTWMIGIILFAFKVWLNTRYIPEYTAIIFVISFSLPLAIIIASYVWLFRAASNLELADNQTRKQSLRRDLRIAKTISIIIGLFFVCWAPFFGLNLAYYVICDKCIEKKTLYVLISVTKIMHYSNSMMNFFVYAERSPDFRNTFKALLFRCDTEYLRDRMRSISAISVRKRDRRNNNGGSFMDMKEKPNNKEQRSNLTVPNNGSSNNHHRFNSDDTVSSEIYSESLTIGFLEYKYS